MTATATTLAPRRPWLSFFDFFVRDREAELRATLLDRGLPIIPNRLVFEHIAKVDHENRPTIWHSVLHIIGYVLAMLSLRLPLHFLTRENQVYVGLMAIVLAGLGGGATYFFDASPLFALPLAAWAFELAVLGFLVLIDEQHKGLCSQIANAVSRWHYFRPSAFFRDTLPARIQHRLTILEETPGVRARILADTSDPFLVAVSGYGPFTKCLIVGAWRTGDAKLDAY